ncbi:hypothetical protein HYALB_00002158 [Hymenoscyphus albidus]|uniref:BTB domain-containing protein n=1 Tax=Hymenoscyphus albidus TaxID=595503 RepID=A0A9N9LQA5_9HELO|nr:hypothetical protein HYALB_00002158 [Hymenoscyphus albidus]
MGNRRSLRVQSHQILVNKCLVRNVYIIRLKVKHVQTAESLSESKRLHSMLASLRNNNKYADLEIHCNGKVFKVHKAIVCGQVDVFAACESRTGVVELAEESPDIVGYFIDFLYTDKYEPNGETAADKFANSVAKEGVILSQSGSKLGAQDSATDPFSSDLLVHTHVYVMADKYMVEPLKTLAKKHFDNALSKLGEKNLHILTEVLETVFEEGNSEVSVRQMETFASISWTIYTIWLRNLRNIHVGDVEADWTTLFADDAKCIFRGDHGTYIFVIEGNTHYCEGNG